jgi:ribonuclease HI
MVWFDGACSGNPGPMGAGAVLEMDGRRESFSVAKGHGTNNEAEYHAVILGLLRAHAAGATRITLRGDSQLVLRQLEGRYGVKAENLKPLVAEAKRILSRFEAVRLEWVPRLENAEADAAARKAIGM